MTFLIALLPQPLGYDSIEGRVHNPKPGPASAAVLRSEKTPPLTAVWVEVRTEADDRLECFRRGKTVWRLNVQV
jgi:hypothetical protein